jgi:carbonic anhydrase
MTHTIHWNYDGATAPEFWGQLDPAYAACSVGKCQSPVDITGVTPQSLPAIEFHYQPTRLRVINNGHTIQINYDAGSYIDMDGARYDLLQFHFHTPSEHTFGGKFADLELHLVHKSQDGKLAVVGVVFYAGTENSALQTIWNVMPSIEGPEQRVSLMYNAIDLLPAVHTTYRYSGSLTTPPCSEGVFWAVMTTPLTMSRAQVNAFEAIFAHNNRPVQPLNGRVILKG